MSEDDVREPDDSPTENAQGDAGCGCLGCSLIILLDLLFAVALYLALQSCN
jgi:hypothetical protein